MQSLPQLVFIMLLAVIVSMLFVSGQTSALKYGAGSYGVCQYNTCSISIASNGAVNLNIAPSASGGYAVAGDTTTVNTGSSTGYTLMLNMVDTGTSLLGALHAGAIAASTGTYATPTSLAANTWGYRLDSGAFGAGPTTAQSGVGAPAATFAGVPASSAPQQIVTTAAPAVDHTTSIWYGAYVNVQLPADDYIGTVTYTAIVN